MDFLLDPNVWIAFAMLTALEIVLGIDNIIFISILVGRLPPERRDKARRLGLGFAMVSRLLHLTIIDILTTGVALRLGEQLRPMLQEIKRNLRAKRYAPPGG